jgi:hypothetical protein
MLLLEGLTALAETGGTALVGAMATDAWQNTRAEVARAVRPGRGGPAGRDRDPARQQRHPGGPGQGPRRGAAEPGRRVAAGTGGAATPASG